MRGIFIKTYKRKQSLAFVSLGCAALLLAAGLYSYSTGGGILSYIVLAFSVYSFYYFYYMMKPFIVIDEEKLIINYELKKKEFLLSTLTIKDWTEKKIEFVETVGGKKYPVVLTLSLLSNEVREKFLEDIQSKVKKL